MGCMFGGEIKKDKIVNKKEWEGKTLIDLKFKTPKEFDDYINKLIQVPLDNSIFIRSVELNFPNSGLNEMKLSTISKHFQKIPKVLQVDLLFSNNDIGDDGARAIWFAFDHFTRLLSFGLDLRKTNISSGALKRFPISLELAPNLESISISLAENKLNDSRVISLITDSLPKLKNFISLNLNLEECGLKDDSLMILTNSLNNLPYIHTLVLGLSENNFSDSGVLSIFAAIANKKSLEILEINVSKNKISNQCALSFFERISGLLKLKEFAFIAEGTNINEEGYSKIAENIKNLKELKSIKIGYDKENCKSEEFIKKITEIEDLKKGEKKEEIDLKTDDKKKKEEEKRNDEKHENKKE